LGENGETGNTSDSVSGTTDRASYRGGGFWEKCIAKLERHIRKKAESVRNALAENWSTRWEEKMGNEPGGNFKREDSGGIKVSLSFGATP